MKSMTNSYFWPLSGGIWCAEMVFHTHFHVLPRTKDDGVLQLPASAKDMISKDDAEAMLAKMK